MATLTERLLKNSTIEYTDILNKSKVYNNKSIISTPVPIVNVAFTGEVDGGITAGILQLAGPSKHFKTGFALLMAKSFLTQYDDGVIMLYDSEFGTTLKYFETYGIDTGRVIHTPITNSEELIFDMASQLEEIKRDDHVMIIIDSIGNLASKKEAQDALDGKSVADMTRAKSMKSMGRIVTPHFNLKDIPVIMINHTYKTMEMYAKDVVSGGTGLYLSANDIWIIGRRQEKDATTKELLGHEFVIRIEKSRTVKEKSEFPVSISYKGGIAKWSGLLELALEGGFVTKTKPGSYAPIDGETGELGEEQKEAVIKVNDALWENLIKNPKFKTFVKDKYTIGEDQKMLAEDSVEELTTEKPVTKKKAKNAD